MVSVHERHCRELVFRVSLRRRPRSSFSHSKSFNIYLLSLWVVFLLGMVCSSQGRPLCCGCSQSSRLVREQVLQSTRIILLPNSTCRCFVLRRYFQGFFDLVLSCLRIRWELRARRISFFHCLSKVFTEACLRYVMHRHVRRSPSWAKIRHGHHWNRWWNGSQLVKLASTCCPRILRPSPGWVL